MPESLPNDSPDTGDELKKIPSNFSFSARGRKVFGNERIFKLIVAKS